MIENKRKWRERERERERERVRLSHKKLQVEKCDVGRSEKKILMRNEQSNRNDRSRSSAFYMGRYLPLNPIYLA